MLKSLIFELLNGGIKQEEKTYSKLFVYCLNVLGLITIIIANYFQDIGESYFLINSGITFIMVSLIIEAVRCYLKHKYKNHALKSTGRNLVNNINEKFIDSISTKKLIKYTPKIIRYDPGIILAFLIYYYIKAKLLKNTTSL